MLKEKPTSRYALKGLARVSLARGDYEKAQKYLDRVLQDGASSDDICDGQALLHLQKREFEEAAALMEKHLAKEGSSFRSWILLAEARFQLQDETALAAAISEMERNRVETIAVSYAKSRLAILRQEWALARNYLEVCQRSRPSNIMILESLLEVCLKTGSMDGAMRSAKRLLALDENHYLGRRTLGSFALSEDDFDLAEAHLAKSIEVRATPEALNDLAWVFYKTDRADEAVSRAKQAIDMNAGMFPAWDTLGRVYMERGQLVEAEEALGKAYELSEGSSGVGIHYSAVLVKQAKLPEAAEVLSGIDKDDLSDEDQKSLKKLKK